MEKFSMTRSVFAHFVRLTDMFRTDLRKANMVEFALGDKLGHDARALIEGHAMNDARGLKQVEFLGPTELGEDKVDLAFKLCLPAADILTAIPDDRCRERTDHHMDRMICCTMPNFCIKTRAGTQKRNCSPSQRGTPCPCRQGTARRSAREARGWHSED